MKLLILGLVLAILALVFIYCAGKMFGAGLFRSKEEYEEKHKQEDGQDG